MLDRAVDHYVSMASQQPFLLMLPTTSFGDELPNGVNEYLSAIARIAAVRQFGLLAHFQREVCPSGAIADDRFPYLKTSF
jgi:hypothetical protein